MEITGRRCHCSNIEGVLRSNQTLTWTHWRTDTRRQHPPWCESLPTIQNKKEADSTTNQKTSKKLCKSKRTRATRLGAGAEDQWAQFTCCNGDSHKPHPTTSRLPPASSHFLVTTVVSPLPISRHYFLSRHWMQQPFWPSLWWDEILFNWSNSSVDSISNEQQVISGFFVFCFLFFLF